MKNSARVFLSEITAKRLPGKERGQSHSRQHFYSAVWEWGWTKTESEVSTVDPETRRNSSQLLTEIFIGAAAD